MAKEYVIYDVTIEGQNEIGRFPSDYIMNPLTNGCLAIQEIIKPATINNKGQQIPPQTKTKAIYKDWSRVKLEGEESKLIVD